MRLGRFWAVLLGLAWTTLAPAVTLTPTPATASQLVLMPFTKPTPIKRTIKTIAQWTGRSIILKRDVVATIQLVPTPKAVTRAQALAFYQKALAKQGLTIDENGKALVIRRAETAK